LAQESPEVALHSRDIFSDHDEMAPSVAQFTFAVGGDRPEGSQPSGGYDEVQPEGFPDGKTTIGRQIVTGQWVFQELIFKATHTGSFEGLAGTISPTGKKVAVKCLQIGRCENGSATAVKLYYDQAALLTQLGLVPGPAVGSNVVAASGGGAAR
jgi:predicted ester cyclase